MGGFEKESHSEVSMSDVTRILSAIEQGDPLAAAQLLPLVYEELRQLAAARLAHEKPGQPLEATALVHEAYLRLVDVQQAQHWNSRGHFFGNVTGTFGFGLIYVEDNLTLNGTIEMPGFNGQLLVGFFDNAADTISGSGSISMGTSQTSQSLVVDLSNNSLTIGPGITMNAGARIAGLVSEASQINVQGTVEDNTATSTLYTYGVDHNTNEVFQDLANLNGGTLTGGTWEFSNGATWRTDGVDITTNAANLSVSGAGTQILDTLFGPNHNALAGLTTNTATGHLTIGAGYTLAVQGSFLNAGILEIGGTISIQGNYTQTADAALDIDIAGPTAFGTLTVSGTATLAGALNVAVSNGYTPALGATFTILTFVARSGDFGTENGLIFSPSEFFVANYLGNTLTLVVS
jgi:hypothetical protein